MVWRGGVCLFVCISVVISHGMSNFGTKATSEDGFSTEGFSDIVAL
jgi:hypothetical protein